MYYSIEYNYAHYRLLLMSRERVEQISHTYCEMQFAEATASNHCLIVDQDDEKLFVGRSLVGKEEFEEDSERRRDELGDWSDEDSASGMYGH